jgi:hypothetical protein
MKFKMTNSELTAMWNAISELLANTQQVDSEGKPTGEHVHHSVRFIVWASKNKAAMKTHVDVIAAAQQYREDFARYISARLEVDPEGRLDEPPRTDKKPTKKIKDAIQQLEAKYEKTLEDHKQFKELTEKTVSVSLFRIGTDDLPSTFTQKHAEALEQLIIWED